jgi:hypothetical protein
MNEREEESLRLLKEQYAAITAKMNAWGALIETTEDQKDKDLRDWFAGRALAGLIANGRTSMMTDVIAQHAYMLADAMMEARKK